MRRRRWGGIRVLLRVQFWPTAMSQIQKMTAQATAITAAITISLTRQRRFGFFDSAWLDAWEAGVAFCDIGDPSVVGRGMSSPSDWTRALRRNSTPYAGTNRIRFEGLLSTLSASVALPCRCGLPCPYRCGAGGSPGSIVGVSGCSCQFAAFCFLLLPTLQNCTVYNFGTERLQGGTNALNPIR